MTHPNVMGLLLLAVMLAPATVRASETFPGTIKDAWRISKLPVKGEGCLLCHMTDPGKSNNATRPFGMTVKSRGAKKADAGSLRNALLRVASEMTHSDEDPISDYQEIAIDGTNPNDSTSYVAPSLPMSDGGSGGEGGTAGAPGTGADAAVGGSYFPPGAFSGPPPYEHGCSLVARADETRRSAFAALALVALLSRITRRALRALSNR